MTVDELADVIDSALEGIAEIICYKIIKAIISE